MKHLRYLVAKAILKSHAAAVDGSDIDRTAWVGSGAQVVESRVGRFTYVGNFSSLLNTSVGAFCSIASGCIIGGAAHPIDWVSTSPVFHRGRNVLGVRFAEHNFVGIQETSIGNDVWIGSNCLVKAGVNIGDGAVIGMGSVLTKDVGGYEIWAGNPARLVRFRFDRDTVAELMRSKWWEYSDAELSEAAAHFTDVSAFLRYVRNRS